jgi:type IX secretion system PorP/SprF family membrane protein
LLMVSAGWVGAQDIHFTLFNYAPLSLNPALTGAYEGSVRVGGIYRDQWSQALNGNQFTTPSFFIDAPIINGFGKNDWVGVGAMFYQDEAGSGELGKTAFLFSGAYHKGFDNKGKSVLTLGVQGGLAQRGFNNIEGLVFADALIGNTSTGETIPEDKTQFLDLSAGVLFRQIVNDNTMFNMGVGVKYLTTPEYNILTGGGSRDLPIRINGHAMLEAGIGDKWLLSPTVLYTSMGPASELAGQIWSGYRINPEKEITLRFGLGYRLGDAGEVLLGLDYGDLRAAVSYDINVSDLSEVSNFRGGFELAAYYVFKIYKDPAIPPVIFCPQL